MQGITKSRRTWSDIEVRETATYGSSDVQKRTPPRISRYANHGLNRGFTPDKRRDQSARLLDTLYKDNEFQGRTTPDQHYHAPNSSEEDLTELQKRMAPSSSKGSLFFQPTHPTKITRYTTHILVVLGWQTIDFRKSIEALWGQFARLNLGEDEGGGETSRDDRGPRIDSKNEERKSKIDEEANLLAEDPKKPLIDDKYFDHYGYFNYLRDPNEKQIRVQAASKVNKANKGTKAQTKMSTKKHKVTNTDDAVTETTPNETQHHEQASVWELQTGTTDTPRVSIASPSDLTISLLHKPTDTTHAFLFPSSILSRDSINWKSREHTTLIAQWRNSIFSQHNISFKRGHSLYSEDEVAWFQLFHAKLRGVIDAGTLIKIPGPVPIREAFNAYFAGKPLSDSDGDADDTGVRPSRGFDIIRGKLENKSGKLVETRKALRELVQNRKDGLAYIPVIVPEELSAYRHDGTVFVDDLYGEGKNTVVGGRSKVASSKRKRQSSEEDSENGKRKGNEKKAKIGAD
ncbi:hypothetical protein DDE83_000011 [Stemphylium lycopersici]|uniref:Uncharacterized protein n=1 Tax=Stemphylium lycopersici TaxID=183478 RepID=A0A364NGR6_STELY|nr:hypothetical protein DDE83_000011 [Stemphylium lycopersici]